jgi:hypothetical protein
VSPASDGCEEPVNPDRRMESRRTGVLAAWLNLRLARPPRSTIFPRHGADSLRRAVQLSLPAL